MLRQEELLTGFKKGLRNGNWRRLSRLEKALHMTSLWYVKSRRSIVNATLVEKLLALIGKLKETKGIRIFKRGSEKAVELFNKYEERGVFTWAPQLKRWLRDPDYIFWLGTMR